MTKLAMLFALALVWTLPTPAYCCLNGVLLSGKEAEREVKRVEQMLSAGKYLHVIQWNEENEVSGTALQRRLKMIVATARVRLKALQEPSSRAGLGNLVYELEQLRLRAADDPLLQARLAEAMVLVPTNLTEAKALIEDLIERDLMPDAEAWATGAYARRQSGDAAGAEAALARCRQIAGRRKRACQLPRA